MTASPNVTPLRIAESARSVRRVFIRNLELLAQIGIYGREKGTHQPVRINVDMTVDDTPVREDSVETVVDYEAITNKIRAMVNAGHINLAETMAERIADLCFEDSRVRTARVRVEKLYALPGAEAAGVEIERSRA